MNKYSEIEIQTVKNLLKEGYKWIARCKYGEVFAYSEKPDKLKEYGSWASDEKIVCVSGEFTPLFQSIKWEDPGPTYIEDIVNPQILDESERQYLSAVIRPFRDQVQSITKTPKMNGKVEYIVIDIGFQMFFPDFKSNTMYKGMELGKEYTLEELGL